MTEDGRTAALPIRSVDGVILFSITLHHNLILRSWARQVRAAMPIMGEATTSHSLD
jgi:hypothetical protein